MARPGPTDRPPRVDVRRSAILINSDGVEIHVVILDVSRGGFRLEVSENLRIGEQVTLLAEHDDRFPAQIQWALGKEAGGVFLAKAPSIV
jgi:PilZ domain.